MATSHAQRIERELMQTCPHLVLNVDLDTLCPALLKARAECRVTVIET